MRDPDASADGPSTGNRSAHRPARPPWERRLTWRGRLARAGGVVLVLAALAGILIGSGGVTLPWNAEASGPPPTSTSNWHPTTDPTTDAGAGQVITLPGGAWQQLQVPREVGRVVSFTPSLTDSGEAFVCGSESNATDAVWATYNGGNTWTREPLPAQRGTPDCEVVSDVTLPHTFVASFVDSNRCAPPTLALTTDDGQSWTPITNLPPALNLKQCWVGVYASGQALYIEYADMVYDHNWGETPPQPVLYYSADLGQTWALSGNILPAWGGIASDAGGMLTATAPAFSPTTPNGLTASALLTSDDGGRTWASVGTISALYPDWLFAAPRASLATLLSHDNLLYGLSEVQIPNLLYRTQIAARQADGRWTLVPPLPVPGTSPTRMGIAEVLAETPSGQLLALGTAPGQPLPDANESLSALPEASAQWLWLWNASRQRWSPVGSPLAVAFGHGALGWQGTLMDSNPTKAPGIATTIWLAHWSDVDVAGETGISIYREIVVGSIP